MDKIDMHKLSPEIFTRFPEEVAAIYTLLQKDEGVKLDGYKELTVYRRILRRMGMQNVNDVVQYKELLENDPQELAALQRDVLIGYTKFFRDALFFDALKANVFPILVRNHSKDEPVRIWIAGCSTGEEAYSVVMSFLEYLEERSLDIKIQIFATDVSAESIGKARTGVYPHSIAADVSAERLKRFFVLTDTGYKIHSRIREICLFVRQNMLDDPYFSRVDLVICRNVLIYLELHAQKKALSRFYHALSVEGILALGISESIGSLSHLYSLVDKKAKIYLKKSIDSAISLNLSFLKEDHFETEIYRENYEKEHTAVERKIDYAILERFGPVGILVNNDLEILQFRGCTNKYLRHMPGKASLNMMKMLRTELIFSVGAAVNQARIVNMLVKKENIQINDDDETSLASVDVIPIQDKVSRQRYFVILFSDEAASTDKIKFSKKLTSKCNELQKQDLTVAQEYVRSVLEQWEGANERLHTAYEEIQSCNEELQAANEELQTRNEQIAQITADLENLFRSINIVVIMLNKDLLIRRFNAGAERMLPLITADIGRQFTAIKCQIELNDLEPDIHQVMDTLMPRETELLGSDGRWYYLQIRPYRTLDNQIDGAVVLLFDRDETNNLKTSLKLPQEALIKDEEQR